ncbi:MAG: DUF421 domain-containing protein [Eubacteriales bacterium]|nr:DUF421 domain-containing protein [Eubacteriales bacterium]
MIASDLGQVAIFSVFSLAALFLLTKLMGNRQMSQLTMFDYITGISIGSLASEVASHPDPDSWLGLVAMLIYGLITVGINIWNTRSLKARNLFLGSPLVIFDHGKLYFDNLKKAKLDLNEIMAECRSAGYFDPAQLQMIILEVNGKLSFLPNEVNRPLTPADMNIAPTQERPIVAVIMDGVLFPKRLRSVGLSEEWLQKQMEIQDFHSYSDILLATVDCDNELAIYEKDSNRRSKDYYA